MLLSGAILLLALATTSAFIVRPLPFSDWAYYWDVAQGSFPYERGGVMVFVLRAFQLLQLEPYATALIMNLAAAAVLLAVAWRAEAGHMSMPMLLVLAYLLVIAPYFSVVQFDLAATALLCVGLWYLASEATGRARIRNMAAALLLVACAVSSRPQFFLVLPVFAALLVIAAAVVGGWTGLSRSRSPMTAAVLLIAALIGFAADSALRSASGRAQAVRTNSGVTLYAGLLSSGDSPPACGHWSEQATKEARDDADQPLLQTAFTRLQERPMGHWLAVVRCKTPGILMPTAYALSWSLGSPNVVERMEKSSSPEQEARVTRLYRAEHRGYLALLVLIYGFALVTAVRRMMRREWTAALLPLLWIASYWAVHAIFEIQARYFLSLFLLLPFMAASWSARLTAGRPQVEILAGEA
ncbi:hypothetical protein [Luteimonas terricola]|uniref:Glycosyltransferase RgtA/B/C/D-like domain-containing protein n=1 Tax=Luteimonas terricola TaxID=645597 RepID=A0ABQ2EJ37_9GAMM|nr:hypothetical protein [Luteimonas terricola]GGK13303.1 hypothetical protein GCM10011394_23170 [Luteimonas terricola]